MFQQAQANPTSFERL